MQILEPDTKQRNHAAPEGHRSVEASQVDVLRNERIVVLDTHRSPGAAIKPIPNGSATIT
jgi:hypothetical protein